jgi:hypothetical protein
MPSENMEIESVIEHLRICLFDARPNFLTTILSDPLSLNRLFVPSAPIDMVAEAMAALGAHTRWRCLCSYEYLIGDCGNINQQGTCPQCKRPIGVVRDQQKLDVHPTIVAAPDIIGLSPELPQNNINHTVRELVPVNYRIIHFLLYGILSKTTATIAPAVLKNYHDVYVEDWNTIAKITGLGRTDMCLFMHSIVSNITHFLGTAPFIDSIVNRRLWENNFTEYYKGTIASAANTAQSFRKKVAREPPSLLSARLNEAIHLQHESPESLPTLFRRRAVITPDNMSTNYAASPQNKESAPLCGLYLRMRENITLLSHLPALISWSNHIISKLNNRIERRTAESETIQDFIYGDDNQREMFQKFKEAWNSVRGYVKGYECRTFEVPEMTDRTTLSYCCIEKRDTGIYLYAMLVHLANIQNEFLEEANISIRTKHDLNEEITKIPCVRLQDAKETEIISVYDGRIEEISDTFSSNDLEYGKSGAISVNWKWLERNISVELTRQKCHLDCKSIEEITYSSELFHGYTKLIGEISKIVAQEKIHIICSQIPPQKVTSLLQLLGLVMCYLKKTGGNPNQTIVSYCKALKIEHNGFSDPQLVTMELRHVIDLYEKLEETTFSSIFNHLEQRYCQPCSSQLLGNLEEISRKLPSFEHMLSLLRKIVIRYLKPNSKDDTHSINLYLDNEAFWTPAIPGDGSFFEDNLTEELLLGHIYEMVKFLERKAEVR